MSTPHNRAFSTCSASPALPRHALAVVLLLLAAAAAGATPKPPAPRVHVDVHRLATDPAVVTARLIDPVWHVRARPGTTLIEIPLRITPAKAPATLDQPPVTLRGARFVCFRIQPAAEGTSANQNPYLNLQNSAQNPQPERNTPGQPRPHYDPLHDENPSANLKSDPPQGAPRVARRITIEPDGSVSWKLDIAIPGEKVAPGYTNYMLRLRARRLRDLLPQRPGPQPRQANESGRDYRQKLIVEQQTFRTQLHEFLARRKRINALPDHFKADHPAVIWAVYEMSKALARIELQGPPPLPWQLSFADFKQIRSLALGARHHQGGADIPHLINLVQHGKPLTQRLIAEALAAEGPSPWGKKQDPRYQLADALLSAHFVGARRLVAQRLAAQSQQRSDVGETLLKTALRDKDAVVKFAALKGLYDHAPTAQHKTAVAALTAAANAVLRATDGPPAMAVLHVLLTAGANAGRTGPNLSGAIDFAKLPAARREETIRDVIRLAPNQPLAATWLDGKLLASADKTIVHETLVALNKMKLAPAAKDPSARQPGMPRTASPTNTSASDDQLDQPIPLTGDRDHLLTLLGSEDKTLRSLAWDDLRLFAISPDADRMYHAMPGSKKVGTTKDPYQLVVDQGLAQQPTPTQLIAFLKRQPDAQRATEALVRVVMHGSGDAGKQAGKAVLDSGRQIEAALRSLSAAERVLFARQLYKLVDGRAAPVASLLAAPQSEQAASWFTRQLQTGKLPRLSAWASAFRTQDDLIRLAASKRRTVSHGAVAALVFAAGGDQQAARNLSQQIDQLPKKSEAAVKKTWDAARSALYLQTLQTAAGRYDLQVTIHLPGEVRPAKPVLLGTVTLVADGSGIRLASQTMDLVVGDQPRTIAMTDLTELKNFDNAEVTKLKLSKTQHAVELTEQKGGRFAGQVPLPSGKRLDISLIPTGKQ